MFWCQSFMTTKNDMLKRYAENELIVIILRLLDKAECITRL